MKRDSYRNPFEGTNASNLDDQTILNYWCSPFAYRLFSQISEGDVYEDPSNIVFTGGRSTGKTMFLRYSSFPVQVRLAHEIKRSTGKTLMEYFTEKKGIGYYLRIDGPVLRSFWDYGIDVQKWNAVFIHYCELLIARNYLESIKVFSDEGEFDRKELFDKFIPQVSSLLRAQDCKTLEELLDQIDAWIRQVDDFRGDVAFYNNVSFKPAVGFASQTLSFGIPRIAKKTLSCFKHGINFVLLIDEYENFLEYQQRVINTLMRFTTSEIKIRLGMKLEGFRTTKMISEDDFIKEGREYRTVVFEDVLNKDKDYRDFLKDVARKRLEAVKSFRDAGRTDIVSFLSESEDLEAEAVDLVRKNRDRHFQFFKTKLPPDSADLLVCRDNPLLEMLNILWVFRGTSPKETKEVMEKYLKGQKNDQRVKKYERDYIHKYKLSLMFVLCSIHRKSKKYYSFNTFSFLSSGIVGHFILLCREAFNYAQFEDGDEALLTEGSINAEQQTLAAMDVSRSELGQLTRIEEHGGRIRTFIDNLGNLFRDFHKDERIRYPETNQFSSDFNLIVDPVIRESFRAGIRWSAIQKKERLQQSAPGKHLKEIYTINRVFCPFFQISYRTRGGYSVSLANDDVALLMKEKDIDSRRFIPKMRSGTAVDTKANPDLFESA